MFNLLIRKQPLLLICLSLIIGTGIKAQVPVPDFSASPSSGCGPLVVNFKDLSTGSPNYWEWDFGNGQISSLQNPSTVYITSGVYTVTLIVRNQNGANSIRKSNYIIVYPFPTAAFSSNLTTVACAPANVQFTDKSTPGQGSIVQWAWNFGDGTVSSDQNPTHTYTQTGYYTVTLAVTNSQGCLNSSTLPRYIRIIPGVQANFTWDQASPSCTAPFTLNFLNQTSGPGNLTYAWSLGSGANPSASTLTNPSATYPSNTNYTVSLTATSDLGCSNTIQQTVALANGNAVIDGPASACINSPISFTNGSTPAPLSSYWTFGDGTNSTSLNPSKTYSATSTYTVKLVNTYASCADSITAPISIVNMPVPNFSASQTAGCQAPFTVNFTDLTTGATAWQWDFGDGSGSTQQNPAHTYTTTGSFNVTLTATTVSGCTGTTTKSNFIQVVTPTVTITQPVQGCINNPVGASATVNAIDGVAGYSWSAPGATPSTSTSPAPSFVYPGPGDGNFTISLTVTTNGGCTTAPATSPVIIGTPTTPSFTVIPASHQVCGRRAFTFTSTSSPVDIYAWDFGDMTKGGDTPVISHAYSNTGSYTVQMIAINHGCSQTGDPTVVKVNAPIANFGYSVDCNNKLLVTFIDSSEIDPAQPVSYTWDYGDGSPTVTVTSLPGVPPPHLYTSYGPYQVTLTVTNGGCTDIPLTKTITLSTLTIAIVGPATVCRDALFLLNSTTSDPSFTQSYAWTVGSTPPTTANSSAFRLAIQSYGPTPVTLTVTDINGCPYTTNTIITSTGPLANFTAPAGGCRNSPITFTDQSTPYNAASPITSWMYAFGDSTNQTFTAPPYTHIYTDTGFYTVTLTVKDVNGCTGSFTSPTPVQITAPQAGFYTQDTLPFYCPNAPLQFVDTSKGYNLTYLWNFGNGTTSLLPAPAPSFTGIGQSYTIKLKVTDQYGCSDSMTRNQYINIQVPIPAFTMTDSTGICIPLQTNFTPNGQYYDSLYWDFGDGSTSTLPNTSHFYNSYGTFPVSLVLQGPGGCVDSITQRVQLINPYQATSFTYSPLKACDSVVAGFKIVPPAYTSFAVYFGDDKVDSSGNTTPTHVYKPPSTYGPSLQLEDPTGCIVVIGGANDITVLGAVPFFNTDHRMFCDQGTVNFTDFTITNDAPINETWNFGDGASVTNPTPSNPSHTYTYPGNFLATLQVSTNSGCNESYTDTVYVYQTPHPVINITMPYCVNTPIAFQGGLVTPEIDSVIWSWSFGDGQTSSLQDPGITFTKPGQYTIDLRTSVSFGCSDSTSQNLSISPLPLIKGPSVITTPIGLPITIPFTYSADVVSYSWTPDSYLSCTNCSNPAANPTFPTLYTVTVTDSNNCMSTDTILVNTICNSKNYFIPNTFSPNGDGVNDVFYPRGDNLYNIQSMTIFNRWGQMVFQRRDFPANSQAMGWDGTFKGKPAPSDVYVYIIEVICNNAQIVALKGDVTLVR